MDFYDVLMVTTGPECNPVLNDVYMYTCILVNHKTADDPTILHYFYFKMMH